ncbi:hypothetical protein LCGC14_0624000 [marine sediment metagenome]|uniref:Uncharacterized protein n=1 Tax=marine sediment metagenome TaxID=412755 RepID=A0A0F9RNC6_9ZZZZ
MKMYDLDLSEYKVDFERWEVEDEKRVLKTGKEPFPIKKEIADMLRIPGVYKDGVESFDGLMLSREIRACEDDSFKINEDELKILKAVMDKLIARDHNPSTGQIALGGPRYEELILRVFGLGRE